jgi:hypothetical protein
MQFPADLKSELANGARAVCPLSWWLALRVENRFEGRCLISAGSFR